MTEPLTAASEPARLRELTALAVIGTAETLSAAGDRALAASIYREWLDHHPDDALRYAVSFNFGVVLTALGERSAAQAALQEAVRLNSGFLPARINLGMVLESLGDRAGAITTWYDIASSLAPVNAETIGHKLTVLKQLGRVLAAANLDGNAEEVLRQSLEIAPHQRDILQHWLSLRQRQCEWPVVLPVTGLTRTQVVAGFSPLSLAAYTDDPLLQLAVAADYCRHDIGRPARSFADAHRGRAANRQSLRIGYLSSDLREHAIGHLMAEVFELHDRGQVEVFAYYCGHQVSDALHVRIKAATDTWVDIADMSDEAAAARILADEIDILVDINGYTYAARTAVLAMRPAPIIVNWLGFPGTTGSPYHDYIIADDIIIPSGTEIYYSEGVKRLPCYQPNDRRRTVAGDPGSRSAAGLPDDATVFCCFNAAHKITPFTWDRWMRILHAVPASVLWLLDGVPTTNARLQQHAAAHGIDPARIVFAAKLANPFHLARYALADLFLDTAPYGAHTTGSDALWMGVPILTLPGRNFASRVCASLVSAAGLPELICPDSQTYVARAIELGTNRDRLDALRRRLRDRRDGCTLFDTPRLVAGLEQIYREMRDDHQGGRLKRPDLANLELYGEIGAGLDRDDQEMAAASDYQALYGKALATRDDYSMIHPDGRLWRGA